MIEMMSSPEAYRSLEIFPCIIDIDHGVAGQVCQLLAVRAVRLIIAKDEAAAVKAEDGRQARFRICIQRAVNSEVHIACTLCLQGILLRFFTDAIEGKNQIKRQRTPAV